MREFNKLVRDNIKDIIEKNGEITYTKVLDDEEYKKELNKKLLEEASEVINSKTKDELIEELADLSEVILAIAKSNDIIYEDIEKTRENLNKILAENTGKPIEQIRIDTERDNFMSAAEACEYGLIDKVIEKR